MTPKQMHVVTIGVMLGVGFLSGYIFRDVAPAVSQMIPYSCTYDGKTYKNEESFPSNDGCNSCGCQNGQVSCTLMACESHGYPVPDGSSGGGTGVVVNPVLPGQSEMAKIPDLQLDAPFSANRATVVPVKYVIEHRSALHGKTVNVAGVIVANHLVQEKCMEGEKCAQTGMYMQPSIVLADTVAPSRNALYDLRILIPASAQIPPDMYVVETGKTVRITGIVAGSQEGVTMSYGLYAVRH